MRRMNCVSCGKSMARSGKTERCTCGGAWVPESALLQMAEQMAGSFVTIPWQPRKGSVRSCPQCGQGMIPVSVERIALDRCTSHGVWFDPQELQSLLNNASKLTESGGFAAPDFEMPAHTPSPLSSRRRPDPRREDGGDAAGTLGAVIGSLLLDRDHRSRR